MVDLTLQDNKEKKLRVFDPRAGSCTGVSSRQLCCQRNSTLCCVCVCMLQEAKGHSGQKDSRVLWLGDSNYVLTAGYSIVS